MKFLFSTLLFLLLGVEAFPQFPGYYIARNGDVGHQEIRLLVENNGYYHIFVNDISYCGKWKKLDKYKIEFLLDNIEAVELYVSNGNKESDQILFTGFGDRKAFFRMGADGEFAPVFKEQPKCSYENTQQIAFGRSKINEVTVAMPLPSDPVDTLNTLYTFRIPENYDEIYIDVNPDAFRSGKKVILEHKDTLYTIEGIRFEKQPIDQAGISRVLAEQRRLMPQAKINQFKKDHYLKTDNIEKIIPSITRKRITIADVPLFSIECPDTKDFPVLPPTQR